MLCGLVLAGCGAGGVESRETAKAAELQERLARLGDEVPRSVLVSLYDDDGGYLCAAAAGKGDLDQVALTGHRFALRKLEVDPRDVGYIRAVVGVYCPDEQQRVDDYVDGLKQSGVGS